MSTVKSGPVDRYGLDGNVGTEAVVLPHSNGGTGSAEEFDWSELLGPLPTDGSGSMALGQSFNSAMEALKSNKLRAVLTMLGIIIGVCCVIVMVALGEGAKSTIQDRLARLGTNLLTVQPGAAAVGGVSTGNGALPTLNDADVAAIQKQIPGISAITPVLTSGGAQVVANNRNWNTQIQANTSVIFALQDWQVARGLPFTQADEQSLALVCDIGQTVATNLFGNANPVGQKILIRNVQFTVKGVLAAKGSNGFRDQDDVILIPYRTAQVRLLPRSSVNAILIQVGQTQDIDRVLAEVTTLLRARHHIRNGQPDDFRIQNNNQILQTVRATSNILTFLLAGVAGVSLIVGGIGIMNIMLVSVTERTREIGIRMAVGARGSNILSQFLVEALMLSVVGGIVGIAIGVGVSALLSNAGGINTIITPSAIAIAFGFSALVGVFFGYYPARTASQLDPIEALRYD